MIKKITCLGCSFVLAFVQINSPHVIPRLIHMFIFYVVNRFVKVVQRLLLGCDWILFQPFQLYSTYIFSFDYSPSLFFFDYPVLINLSVPKNKLLLHSRDLSEYVVPQPATDHLMNHSVTINTC